MIKPRNCLACSNQLDAKWRFCLECGARVDENVVDEARSIDYLLGEMKDWRSEALIDDGIAAKLGERYQSRKDSLIASIRHRPPAPNTDATAAATFIVKNQPTSSDQPPSDQPVQPPIPPPVQPLPGLTPQAQLAAAAAGANQRDSARGGYYRQPNSQSERQRAAGKPPAEVKPPRSFPELVSDNIRMIFSISAALFVGGILLYYRNEIYHGLSQPVVQAAILIMLTLASLLSGIALVRRTDESLAGRTLTLVGALLVPINPWFLVRSHLIADSGNSWILGLACTALYAAITYFLRDRIFVYITLASAIISGWALVYKFSPIGSASIYAVVLMVCSIAALLAERAFKPAGKDVTFSREEFGRPFFHVAQIGIALCLLFYTPLITLLPNELVAAKEHFDPYSYNSFITVWLSLSAVFAYCYSALSRKASYFIYLAIAAFFWSETSLLMHLHAGIRNALLAYISTALIMEIISHSALNNFFARPLNIVARVIGLLYTIAISFVMVGAIFEGRFSMSWRMIAAYLVAVALFSIELRFTRSRVNLHAAAILFFSDLLILLFKIDLDAAVIVAIMPLPAYLMLWLAPRLRETVWQHLIVDLQAMAVGLAAAVTVGAITHNSAYTHSNLAVLLWPLEIAGVFVVLSYQLSNTNHRLIAAFISVTLVTIDCGLGLDILLLDREVRFGLLGFALLSLVYYSASHIERLGREMCKTLSVISTILAGGMLLITTCLYFSSIFFYSRSRYREFAVSMVLTLLIVGIKESWHLKLSRSALHATLTALIGGSLLAGLLIVVSPVIRFETGISAFTMLAIGYLILADNWRRRALPRACYLPFEIVGQSIAGFNLAVLTIILFLDHHFSGRVFIATILSSSFYLLAANLRKCGGLLYPGMLAVSFCFWQFFTMLGLHSGYYPIAFAASGLLLLMLSQRLTEPFKWAFQAISTSSILLYYGGVFFAIGMSLAALDLFNIELDRLIITLLAITAIGALMSTQAADASLRRAYRYTAFILSCSTYCTIGIRLGFDLFSSTEFYTIPIGSALLLAGYLSLRKSADTETTNTASVWLTMGSFLVAVPMLLHALHYRFVMQVASTGHDAGLLVVSLVLVLGGILLQWKAPTIIGGATFLIELTVIVFSFVNWEQKWLSVAMIMLALVVFVSAWLISIFAKRNQFSRLNEQGRAIMQQFGRWK